LTKNARVTKANEVVMRAMKHPQNSAMEGAVRDGTADVGIVMRGEGVRPSMPAPFFRV
jgi:hypothetical protein